MALSPASRTHAQQSRLAGESARLFKNMALLRKKIPGPIVRDVLEKAGESVREAIESRAPVRARETYTRQRLYKGRRRSDVAQWREFGGWHERGFLKKNIIRITIQKSGNTTVAIGPHADVWYAHFPEFGTVHSQASPYIRPGFKATKVKAKQMIERGLWGGIERTIE